MTHLWDAERTIELNLALKLINEQFPELDARQIRKLGRGWDNTAFIINEKLIFRFPRRKIAVSLLEEEWVFLPKLAPYLSLSIPVPKWKGLPTAQFPWPFSGYSFLSGRTACQNDLCEKSREALAPALALFLKKLHSLPIQAFPQNFFSHQYSRIDGNLINEKIKKNFTELEKLGLIENRRELEIVIKNSQNFKAPVTTSVVHGDFYIRHLLLDEEKKLSGIIDWGNVHIGDPANDLAIAHTFLPLTAHAIFKELYGNLEETTWQLARLKAILSGTYLILFGHHSKDLTIKREGLRTLKIISQASNNFQL